LLCAFSAFGFRPERAAEQGAGALPAGAPR
jgi:hypothetical protein